MRKTASDLGWRLEEAQFANLRLSVDGSVVEPSISGHTVSFPVSVDATDVYLMCNSTRPYNVGYNDDGRCLGLYINRIAIVSCEGVEVDIDDSLLCIGFYPSETNGSRWTTSRARIPRALWKDCRDSFRLQLELGSSPLPRWVNRGSTVTSTFALASAIEQETETPASRVLSAREDIVFYWCDDTFRQEFETGVQRVTLRLLQGLRDNDVLVVPVGWDWDARKVVTLGDDTSPGGHPLENILATCANRRWLVMPELPLALAEAGLDPLQIARAYDMRTAVILHDLIPLKSTEYYDDDFLARFRRYFQMFRIADIIIVGTEYIAGELREELERSGFPAPPIVVIPFAAQLANFPRIRQWKAPRRQEEALRLLTISTWERRKNLPLLLEAVRQAALFTLVPIELAVVGQRGGDFAYNEEIVTLSSTMSNIALLGTVNDDSLSALYYNSHFTVYSSCEEGFGLPIVESLWSATPVVCHHASAMAEIAIGGGVLKTNMLDCQSLTRLIVDLAERPSISEDLCAELLARPLLSWKDYACKVYESLSAAICPT